MALFLKKLGSRSSSVFVPYLRRLPNHPRPFMSEIKSVLELVDKKIAHRLLVWIFNINVPYTSCSTRKITSNGEETGKLLIDENRNAIISDDRLQTFLTVPGIEKTTETDEELRVFLELEMEDIEHSTMKAKLKKKKNAVIITGYVQKQDLRKYYDARVELPLPPREICEPIKIEMKDGGLVVTIPKVVKKEPPQRLLTD